MAPHFRIKWNSPLNVFRKYNKGALNNLSNQANYHRLGRVLNSPPLNAKCKMSIKRACRGCNGAKVKGEKSNIFGKSGAK